MQKQTLAFGAWPSPVSPELIVAQSVRLEACAVSGEDGYWLEGRPAESGRCVVVKRSPGGAVSDLTPPPYSVRSRVHEYGGGTFCVHGDSVWFVNDSDQRIYRRICQRGASGVEALTAPGPHRYADLAPDPHRRRLYCVRESHDEGAAQPRNSIVAVCMNTGAVQTLAEGRDFYSNPRPSPDGRRLCWLEWDHPQMPWQGTRLWLSNVAPEGAIEAPVPVCGGTRESVFQPQWSPHGVLHFVSDRSGWWNLYCLRGGEVKPLCPMSAEFGLPQWVFGMSTYGFTGNGQILCTYCQHGQWRLARIAPQTGKLVPIAAADEQFESLAVGDKLAPYLGGSPTAVQAVQALHLDSNRVQTLKVSSAVAVDDRQLSKPRPVSFDTDNGQQAHGFYYPPVNAGYQGPARAAPPLMVIGHGGPTGATSTVLKPAVQYWTGRGFALLDVNYRGSTGYGRPYRELLAGRWGEADVLDCVHGAGFLVARKLADPDKLAVRGSSAGGFTALAALTFHDTFKAGASYYGIAELKSLARDTHKFESRYLDWLIGPYPAAKALYRARSPVHFTAQLTCAVIFFQGLKDPVVPPDQARMMVTAMQHKGLPVAHLEFADEGHGFRRADTIRRTLEAELYFYGQIFGFTVIYKPAAVLAYARAHLS